jgi:hypothetical protein
VNSGGEPERDDTGLPPVDIEIPDDARELDRDVQAYYREQRAERRRLRQRRLHRTITRDGFLLPLLACFLILALITGTLLTIFTATSEQNLTPLTRNGTSTNGSHARSGTGTSRPAARRPASSHPASSPPASSGAVSSRPSASPGSSAGRRAGSAGSAAPLNPDVVQTGQPLPASGVLVLQATNVGLPLRSLHEAMLVLVPPACECGPSLSWLAGIAVGHGAQTFLVGTSQTIGEVNQLHSGLPANLARAVWVALDSQGVLAQTYTVKGLTAVMVARHSIAGQSAEYAQRLSVKDRAEPLIRALTG